MVCNCLTVGPTRNPQHLPPTAEPRLRGVRPRAAGGLGLPRGRLPRLRDHPRRLPRGRSPGRTRVGFMVTLHVSNLLLSALWANKQYLT